MPKGQNCKQVFSGRQKTHTHLLVELEDRREAKTSKSEKKCIFVVSLVV
jgi:hypothetical protein